MRYTTLHDADVALIPGINVRVMVWRSLKEFRLVLGLKGEPKPVALCVMHKPKSKRIATLHFAKGYLDLETVAHEAIHAVCYVARTHDLDHHEAADDEVIANLGGKLVDLTYAEVSKCATN